MGISVLGLFVGSGDADRNKRAPWLPWAHGPVGKAHPVNRQVSSVEDSRVVVALGSAGVRGQTSELCLENFSRILLPWIWIYQYNKVGKYGKGRNAAWSKTQPFYPSF